MTRPLILVLCSALLFTAVSRGAPEDTEERARAADDTTAPSMLTVRVVDLRNRKGQVRLGVFDRARGFPTERNGALLWQSAPAGGENCSFAVELPPGRYAVVVLHDENGNKKVDRNFVGVPKEGYGVTNNPKPAMRAATYREAAFDLPPEGAEVRVSIQYF